MFGTFKVWVIYVYFCVLLDILTVQKQELPTQHTPVSPSEFHGSPKAEITQRNRREIPQVHLKSLNNHLSVDTIVKSILLFLLEVSVGNFLKL